MIRAVLLDAHGTLLRLEPPAPALRRRLRRRLGVEVTLEQAERAMAAEITYYRTHLGEGRDDARVAELRRRCAGALRGALPPSDALDAADGDAMTEILLDSLAFRPYPDARPALRSLRASGLRLVVASNWDASLPATLASVGLASALDGVVTSAECGEAKPEPGVFRAALALAGARAEEAVHVGDRLDEDVAGARAAGIEPILLARGDAKGRTAVLPATIRSLSELPGLLAVLPSRLP